MHPGLANSQVSGCRVWAEEDALVWVTGGGVVAGRREGPGKKSAAAETWTLAQGKPAALRGRHWYAGVVFNFPSPGLGVSGRNPSAASSQYILAL